MRNVLNWGHPLDHVISLTGLNNVESSKSCWNRSSSVPCVQVKCRQSENFILKLNYCDSWVVHFIHKNGPFRDGPSVRAYERAARTHTALTRFHKREESCDDSADSVSNHCPSCWTKQVARLAVTVTSNSLVDRNVHFLCEASPIVFVKSNCCQRQLGVNWWAMSCARLSWLLWLSSKLL